MEQEIVEVRTLRSEDYLQLKNVMLESYPGWGVYWRRESLENLIRIFPKGQFVICVNDKVVGSALSIIVNYSSYRAEHTFSQVTGNYTFSTHDPSGNTLYGIEVFIHPDYRGRRFGRRLYDARKELCEKLNLRNILFGGRMPHYHKYKDTFSPKEYLQKVKNREIFDPTLNFQISNDFQPVKVLKNYMPGDDESGDYAVLLEWNNIYYSKTADDPLNARVRLGLIQWQMRLYKEKGELMQQAEYFIDSVSSYQCDFAVLPELFNAPLMANFNNLSEAESMRKLGEYTEELRTEFSELAVKYNVNIIMGSVPLIENGRLMNVGYLCKRNGEVERYEKLHITRDEEKYWAIKGGNKLKVYDTDCGKIGILICYDVEFPELSRYLADQGMKILFVPFLTDTQTAYYRVRHCAQARAIENECFVAICGSVGNLPKVENMDIQYARSAVLTPCDFAFPDTGVKGEAIPNSEMLLIVDVDLSLLKELHHSGSVTNLINRRADLYTLNFNNGGKEKKE